MPPPRIDTLFTVRSLRIDFNCKLATWLAALFAEYAEQVFRA